MTEEEYTFLNSSIMREFKLYTGPTIKGYLGEEDGDYYVFQNRTQTSRKLSEIGHKVNLSSILPEPRPLNAEEIRNLSIIKGIGMKMPPYKARKMIIIGAGASYDYTYERQKNNDDRPPLANSLFHDRHTQTLQYFRGAEVLSADFLRVQDLEMHFQIGPFVYK